MNNICKVAWFHPEWLEGMVYDVDTGEYFYLTNIAAKQLKELLLRKDALDSFKYKLFKSVKRTVVISIRI